MKIDTAVLTLLCWLIRRIDMIITAAGPRDEDRVTVIILNTAARQNREIIPVSPVMGAFRRLSGEFIWDAVGWSGRGGGGGGVSS